MLTSTIFWRRKIFTILYKEKKYIPEAAEHLVAHPEGGIQRETKRAL
jgi:hypothetical protein